MAYWLSLSPHYSPKKIVERSNALLRSFLLLQRPLRPNHLRNMADTKVDQKVYTKNEGSLIVSEQDGTHVHKENESVNPGELTLEEGPSSIFPNFGRV